MQYDNKELAETIRIAAINSVLTSDIFRVIAVNPENQTVDLEPCVKVWKSDPDGEIRIDSFGDYRRMSPTTDGVYLLNVPVQQIRCGQFSITIPVAVGDCGIVHFLRNDIQNWSVTGGQADALYVHPFDPQSCVYSGFVPNDVSKDLNFNTNSLEIKSKSAIIRVSEESIDIETKSNVNIKAEAGVNVTGDTNITGKLTVSDTVTASDCLAGAISLKTHTHVVNNAVPASAGPVLTDVPQ